MWPSGVTLAWKKGLYQKAFHAYSTDTYVNAHSHILNACRPEQEKRKQGASHTCARTHILKYR